MGIMDKRFLFYYNRELQHLREMSGEFAAQYPKIAGRLGLDAFDCVDPYVERLLEGCAFLSARVQVKLDAEFPRFTQHLFETVAPHYLSPVPSMAIVQFQPDLNEGALEEGFVIPRDSVLRSVLGSGDQTSCEYRTAHELTLWPLEIVDAQYYTREVATLDVPQIPGAKAAVRIRLRTTAGLTFDKLSLDDLTLFLRGSDETPMHLYEQFFSDALGLVVRPITKPAKWREVLDTKHIHQVGFDDNQALLPYSPCSFHGYRLLQEYFAFPDRYKFVRFSGLSKAVQRCQDTELDFIILLSRNDLYLENAVEASHFALFCAPSINLFPKRADRIHLSDRTWEYHVIPDRTRPLDFEVYRVNSVSGFGSRSDEEQEFKPFYSADDLHNDRQGGAYFATHRVPRTASSRERRQGRRSSYAGSEVYVSLVDSEAAPYRSELRQLAVSTLCTNRDLPLHMPTGRGRTDFNTETGAPVESVRCIVGPTRPRPSHAEGERAWRLVSHLSLNYLSLVDHDESQGAAALRDLLKLYGEAGEAHIGKQIEGVKSIASAPLTRRVATPGPITFARGLEVGITFDEAAFEGTGVFLLGAVLERFFAKYVSINSFTETVIKTLDRGEVIRWPARIGQRHMI